MEAQTYGVSINKELSNASEDQLAPVPYVHNGDTGIVFMSNIIIPGTSRPRLNIITPDTSGADQPPSKSPMDLYFYDQSDRKGVKKIRLLDPGGKFYTIGDDGPATFSGDFTTMCIVQPQRNDAGEPVSSGFGGLFLSEWIDGVWSDPEPFPHNDPAINFGTPCLSDDGQLLFFAAEGDLEGALGGMDLYYSMRMSGSWSAPVNLGDRINTPDHEIFPFYYQFGEAGNPNIRLYFSSKGHNARAGTFDLFYSVFNEGEWLKPMQVPSLNTRAYDELGIYLTDNVNEGMFSRREGADFNIYNIRPGVVSYESFPNPGPMKKASLCYRIYENSIDTIDPVVFDYEWVIEDTLRLPGHDVQYCFPGPGEYSLAFNVTNKLTDTTIYNAAHLELTIREYIQPVISAPDTVVVGERIDFTAAESNLPEDWEQVEYFWEFGDGSFQKKGENVTYYYEHSYEEPREYTVTLGAKKVLNRREERLVDNNELPISEYKIAVVKDITVLPD